MHSIASACRRSLPPLHQSIARSVGGCIHTYPYYHHNVRCCVLSFDSPNCRRAQAQLRPDYRNSRAVRKLPNATTAAAALIPTISLPIFQNRAITSFVQRNLRCRLSFSLFPPRIFHNAPLFASSRPFARPFRSSHRPQVLKCSYGIASLACLPARVVPSLLLGRGTGPPPGPRLCKEPNLERIGRAFA